VILVLPDEVIESSLAWEFIVANLAIEDASIPHTPLVCANHGVETFRVARALLVLCQLSSACSITVEPNVAVLVLRAFFVHLFALTKLEKASIGAGAILAGALVIINACVSRKLVNDV
jgi:hypothetical protein